MLLLLLPCCHSENRSRCRSVLCLVQIGLEINVYGIWKFCIEIGLKRVRFGSLTFINHIENFRYLPTSSVHLPHVQNHVQFGIHFRWKFPKYTQNHQCGIFLMICVAVKLIRYDFIAITSLHQSKCV